MSVEKRKETREATTGAVEANVEANQFEMRTLR
jgi:hypothetical protein